MAFAQKVGAPLKLTRKGVGRVASVQRPRYNLEEKDPHYFTKARDSADDYIKQRLVVQCGSAGMWSVYARAGMCVWREVWGGRADGRRPTPLFFSIVPLSVGRSGLAFRFLQKSAFGEAEFSAAASFLAPSKDYGEVGNVDSHTKFVVAPDARVRCANGSV